MRSGGAAVAVFSVWIATLGGQSAPPVFRVAAESVAVNVAVKRGNNAATGLTAADFRLYDNDVLQHVAAISQDAVPLDVSFVVDLSVSVFRDVETPRESVRRMASFLRPVDRFRVLTMGQSVVNSVPWQSAGPPDASRIQFALGHLSLVADSVLAALIHRADPERRHLVVGLTDGEDICSITTGDTLRRVAERSGGVFHWVNTALGGTPRTWTALFEGVESTCRNAPARPIALAGFLSDVTRLTGGSVHTARSQTDVKGIALFFDAILNDFRRSYILHYEPQGVSPGGWHRLRVEVPGRQGYAVRTRPGYWGSETVPGLR